MGSGLILLIIVGAWLAVLVPMGLRSYEGTGATRPTERLGEAVRVLSRRSADAPAGVTNVSTAKSAIRRLVLGARPAAAPTYASRSSAGQPSGGLPSAGQSHGGQPSGRVRRSRRPVMSVAARRRRVLVVLTALALVLSVAALGVRSLRLDLLLAAGGVLLVALLYVVHCRRSAAAHRERLRVEAENEELAWAQWERDEAEAEAESYRLAELEREAEIAHHLARLPSRLPARPPTAARTRNATNVRTAATVRTAARERPGRHVSRERPAVRAALGAPWQPVPVPLPTYLGKSRGPEPTRAPDRTPSQPAAAQGEVRPEDVGDGHENEAQLGRRRVPGGW